MKIVLASKKLSGYTLPLTKRIARPDQPIEVTKAEADLAVATGHFLVCEEEPPSSAHAGVSVSPASSFVTKVPDDWTAQGILIKCGGGIGDCLIASAAAAYLKREVCAVTMAVSSNAMKFVELIKQVDAVANLTESNTPAFDQSFDVVLDLRDFLQGTSRTVVEQDFYARAYEIAGISATVMTMPTLEIPTSVMSQRRLPLITRTRRFVGIHPDASSKHRCWNDIGWRTVIEHCTTIGLEVLIFGQDGSRFDGIDGVLDCTEMPEAEQVFLLKACRVLVCTDSCFMHLAGISGVPIVGLFGFSVAEHCAAHYRHVHVVKGRTPCECKRILRSKDCTSAFACMQSVDTVDVLHAIEGVFWTQGMIQKRATFKAKKNLDSVVENSADRLHRNQKVCFVFPWLYYGGGEVSMMNVAKSLEKYFDLTVYAFDLERPRLRSIRDELISQFENLRFLQSTDLSMTIFDGFDIVLWYGVNEQVPIQLGQMARRPISIRVSHTTFQDEGPDFAQKWESVIDGTVSVNPEVARQTAKIIEDSVFIGNPIPADLGEVVSRTSSSERPTIGFLGRLDSNKQVEWLARSLEALECDLVMKCMESDEISLADFKRILISEGTINRVRFLEVDRDIAGFFAQIDALVICSKKEGFPMAVIEAGHFGVPVISTRVGALPELFETEIKFISSSATGIPSVDELKTHAHKLWRGGRIVGHKLQKKVQEICNIETVADGYRRTIRRVFGKSFDAGFQNGHFKLERFEGVGDVLMSTALVARLTETFPMARFTYMTQDSCVSLLQNTFPKLSVLTPGTGSSSSSDVSVAVDYHHCWEKNQHIVEGMGGKRAEVQLVVDRKPKSRRRFKRVGFVMSQNKDAKNRSKEWPVEMWEALATKLGKDKLHCFQLGSKDEELLPFLKDGRSDSLEGLTEQILDMNWVITIDNAAVHLGKALDVPMVVLFGKSSQPWLSSYDLHHNVQSLHECSCMASVSNDLFGRNDCCSMVGGEGPPECMEMLELDSVVEAFEGLSKRSSFSSS